jgi:hypothetical protein
MKSPCPAARARSTKPSVPDTEPCRSSPEAVAATTIASERLSARQVTHGSFITSASHVPRPRVGYHADAAAWFRSTRPNSRGSVVGDDRVAACIPKSQRPAFGPRTQTNTGLRSRSAASRSDAVFSLTGGSSRSPPTRTARLAVADAVSWFATSSRLAVESIDSRSLRQRGPLHR